MSQHLFICILTNSMKVSLNMNICVSHHISFSLFIQNGFFQTSFSKDLISETRRQLSCGHPLCSTELDSRINKSNSQGSTRLYKKRKNDIRLSEGYAEILAASGLLLHRYL
jgi:hypothetical protein